MGSVSCEGRGSAVSSIPAWPPGTWTVLLRGGGGSAHSPPTFSTPTSQASRDYLSTSTLEGKLPFSQPSPPELGLWPQQLPLPPTPVLLCSCLLSCFLHFECGPHPAWWCWRLSFSGHSPGWPRWLGRRPGPVPWGRHCDGLVIVECAVCSGMVWGVQGLVDIGVPA